MRFTVLLLLQLSFFTVVAQTAKEDALKWQNYDFIPGTEIIFEDNLLNEQNGEFPSKWDLVGGVVENANLKGDNIIMFVNMGAFLNKQGIVPLMENPDKDYLPEAFTVEFDAYFEMGLPSQNLYRVYLYDAKSQKSKIDSKTYTAIDFTQQTVSFGSTSGAYPNTDYKANKPFTVKNPNWRHMAISFNKRALKVYLDDARIINVPNAGFDPKGLTILFNARNNKKGYIKNVRIAQGAVPLYDKLLTDGKFTTTGIKFDVDKATIKPESMGVINFVAKMMSDHPELRFSIEGHTDSDGSETANQTLSEKRAEAVKNELAKLGINANRLTSKGWGESKPTTANSTSEGKAQNRRVEFIKINN
ncbi:MAG: OmpA family protein [Bacteroidales bacterium]|nr:OmpA family protein [Bacteroidales bacterium]